MSAVEPPPSEEAPAYTKVRQRRDDGTLSSLCMIVCDEGWRTTILCSGVYERDADFLLELLGRTSRLPSVRERAAGDPQ